jgi:hypothetical protein
MRVAKLLLRGAGGEPVDFARTIVSHGVAELPPNRVALDTQTLETTLPVRGGARTVRLTARDGKLLVDMLAGRSGARVRETLTSTVVHMFRLDEDLFGSVAPVRTANNDLTHRSPAASLITLLDPHALVCAWWGRQCGPR